MSNSWQFLEKDCQIRGIFTYQDGQIRGKMRPEHAETDDMFWDVNIAKHIIKTTCK